MFVEEMNSKSIVSLDFMGQYAGLEVEINDGRIVGYTCPQDRHETKKQK